MLAAYTGTILPDDLLSGGSLAVITGVLLSVPVIGTHLVFWIFGGAPPGHQIIGRDYWVHILVLAGAGRRAAAAGLAAVAAVAAPAAARSAAAVHLRGAGPARRGRADQPGVAVRAVPAGQHQRRRGAGLVHGLPRRRAADHAGLAGRRGRASAGPRRADPGPGRARPVLHLLAAYPRPGRGSPAGGRITSRAAPATRPARTAAGAAGITFYGLLWAAAANDQIAYHLHLDLYTVTWIFRIAVIAGPLLACTLTRAICHGLARRRRDEELHGRETGRIVMSPDGGYTEIHEPAHRAAPPSADQPGPATARRGDVAERHPALHRTGFPAKPMRGSHRGSHDRS